MDSQGARDGTKVKRNGVKYSSFVARSCLDPYPSHLTCHNLRPDIDPLSFMTVASAMPTLALTAAGQLYAPSTWQPSRMADAPAAPPIDTREAELAALAAQEKLGHDGKRQRVRPRRTIDPFGGLERWKIVRCYQAATVPCTDTGENASPVSYNQGQH